MGAWLALEVLALAVPPPRAAALPLRIRAKADLRIHATREADGLHLRGALRDDAGAPVAGQPIVVTLRGLVEQPVDTADDGSFDVLVRPGDVATLRRDYGAQLEWRARFEGSRTVSRVESFDQLDLRRRPTRTTVAVRPETVHLDADSVQVTATVGSSGGAVTQADIRLQVADGPELAGETDDQGRTTFVLRPAFLADAGAYSVIVRYQGDTRFAPSSAEAMLRVVRPTRLTLRAGREGEPATGRYRFSGRLADADGGLEGQTVVVEGVAAGAQPRTIAAAATQADGVFLVALDGAELFRGLDSGTRLEIRARFEPSGAGRRLSHAASAVVPVRVPAPEGLPLRWYLVALCLLLGAWAGAIGVRRGAWRAMPERLRAAWGRWWPPWGRAADAAPSEEAAPAFLVSAPGGGGRRDALAGQLVDAHTRAPLGGAMVTLWGPEGARLRLVADAHGAVEAEGLASGDWHLRADAYGYLPRESRFQVPHDGGNDGAMLSLVAIRRRVRDLLGQAVGAHDGRLRWGRDTPEEAVHSARSVASGAEAALAELRRLVERAFFGLEPLDADHAVEAEGLHQAVMAAAAAARDAARAEPGREAP